MPIDIHSADDLQKIIETQQSLTTLHEQFIQGKIATWAAMREGDKDALRALAAWPSDRPYVPDPLPGRMSEAFADLLFGEDPIFTAAEAAEQAAKEEAKADNAELADLFATEAERTQRRLEANEQAGEGPDRSQPVIEQEADADDREEDDTDQARLDAIIEANELASELRGSELLCSSEGEVWWRVYTDEAQMDYPIIDWYSRSHVRPLFRGKRLVAAAFYAEIYRDKIEDEYQLYRWVGIYSAGHVRNLLYRGTPAELGTRIDLSARPETDRLQPEWNHGFEMLCGRIPNKLGRDRRVGISDYEGVRDLILSLNEATTVGHENMRLTAKKRMIVPSSQIKDGTWDAGEDVIPVDDEQLDTELGRGQTYGRYSVLEYSFDAQALKVYTDDLVSRIVTRVGLVQQFISVGSGGEGLAESGTALRTRLLPTTLTANGKGRFWDDALPRVLMLAQLVDKDQFNREWKMAGEPPAVERSPALPDDPSEDVTRHAAAVGAELESRFIAIKSLHPDWSREQVTAEVKRILKETAEMTAAVSGGGGGPPGAMPGQVPPPPGFVDSGMDDGELDQPAPNGGGNQGDQLP
jgi:hypothetical protein